MPRMETTLTMLPRPASSIERPTSWLRAKAAVRLTSRTSANRSGVSDSAACGVPTPALLTRMSTCPKRSRAVAINRSRSPASTTSHRTASPSSSSASCSRRSALLAATTTDAPAPASTSANRAPRPLEAPLTIATCPSSRKGSKTSTESGQEIANAHRLQASRARVGNQRGKSGDGAGVARVQADDRSRLQRLPDASLDGCRTGIQVVARVDVEAAHHAVTGEPGLLHHDRRVVALHSRRTEVATAAAGLRRQHVAAADHLAPDGRRACAPQLWMGQRVVLELIAGIEDATGHFGVLLEPCAHNEDGDRRGQSLRLVEQLLGEPQVARPVEGERHHLAVPRARVDDARRTRVLGCLRLGRRRGGRRGLPCPDHLVDRLRAGCQSGGGSCEERPSRERHQRRGGYVSTLRDRWRPTDHTWLSWVAARPARTRCRRPRTWAGTWPSGEPSCCAAGSGA